MRTAIALLLALFVTAGAARAEHCAEATPEVTLDTPVGTFYVDNELCQPDCLFSVWIYQESNGQEGLQRGDETCTDDDECCGQEADTIVF